MVQWLEKMKVSPWQWAGYSVGCSINRLRSRLFSQVCFGYLSRISLLPVISYDRPLTTPRKTLYSFFCKRELTIRGLTSEAMRDSDAFARTHSQLPQARPSADHSGTPYSSSNPHGWPSSRDPRSRRSRKAGPCACSGLLRFRLPSSCTRVKPKQAYLTNSF